MNKSIGDEQLTIKEIKDWQQYWWSKVCNSVTIDQKEVYKKLYEAYLNLEEFYLKFNKDG